MANTNNNNNNSAQPKIRLSYFDLGGRAEGIRMLLNHAQVEFEDHRVTGESWATLKSNKTECPTGKVPVLRYGDKVLTQSQAILRYVGMKYGYYSLSENIYDIDLAIETILDFWSRDFNWSFFGSDPVPEEKVKFTLDQQTKLLTLLQDQLGDKLYFGGQSLSTADFFVFSWLTMHCMNPNGNPHRKDLYEKHAELLNSPPFRKMKAFGDRMYSELEDYMKTRSHRQSSF